MHIYLIGYRCTGKTTVGKAVAVKLGRPFMDTDALVTAHAGCSIKAIVEDYGWEAFRRLEKQALAQIAASNPCVAATGGGIVLDDSNVALMQKQGILIWLTAHPGTIASRMAADPKTSEMRPALTRHDRLKEISQASTAREPLYRSAGDFALATDRHDIDALAAEILRLFQKSATRRSLRPEPENSPAPQR